MISGPDAVAGEIQRLPFANAFFFPAAALYGAALVPWWILGFLGRVPVAPGLATAAGHGHEMVFGYAFAVIAGYLLGRQPLPVVLPLLALWLAARLSFLLWPGSWIALGAVALFAAGVAMKVVPRFGRPKKWRNLTIVPVIVGLALLAVTGSAGFGTRASWHTLRASLVLLAVLLFFMGGRIIAPAVAGHLMRRGRTLDARVQPRLEGAVLLALFGALLLLLVPVEWGGAPADFGRAGVFSNLPMSLAAGLLMFAGVLTLVRLLRWRFWHCTDRPDLLVLAVGYGWIAFGLLLLGITLVAGTSARSASHALSVGALGTLTVAVMARTRLLYRFRDANAAPSAHVAALLMSAAALARLLYDVAAPAGLARPVLVIASGCWCVALLIVAGVVLHTLPSARARDRSPTA